MKIHLKNLRTKKDNNSDKAFSKILFCVVVIFMLIF